MFLPVFHCGRATPLLGRLLNWQQPTARGHGKGDRARVIYYGIKSEVAKARQSLALKQEAFAGLLGTGLRTLRSWERKKREPSGATRILIATALKHPEVPQEAVA